MLLDMARLSDFRIITIHKGFAEKDMDNLIHKKYIIKGWHNIKCVSDSHRLKQLTDDHRILYELIKEKEDIQTGELWELYLSRCKNEGFNVMGIGYHSQGIFSQLIKS